MLTIGNMITAQQIRAGRTLAGVRQKDLAQAAEVSQGTLLAIEKGTRGGLAVTLGRIQAALEARGVRFTEGGGVEPR